MLFTLSLSFSSSSVQLIQNECRDYSEYLERMTVEEKSGESGTAGEAEAEAASSSEEEQLAAKLETLKTEEEELLKELAELEAEKLEMEKEKKTHEEELDKLAEEEDENWKLYSEYKRQVLELEDDQRSVDNNLKYAQNQVDKLKKTNVFNSTFHIWHNGHFGYSGEGPILCSFRG